MTDPPAAAGASSSSSSSSLDTLQTTEKPDPENPVFSTWTPEDDDHQRFCHGGWSVTRRRVRDALIRTAQSPDRICRFQDCGKDCWVYQHKDDPTNVKVIANHCMDRFCITCGGLKAWKVRAALRPLMKNKQLRFCTLTLSGQGGSLAELLDRLYRHFKALRQTELWEKSVDGGCAFLEVKWNPKAKRWHPHLHLILEGRYLPQAELSNTWRALTKDSWIVDVRSINKGESAANYVTKYATKPLNSSFAGNSERLDEAVMAMKGRRFIFCFGSWYGTPLSDIDTDELFDSEANEANWTSIGRLNDLTRRCREGDNAAKVILANLAERQGFGDGEDADDG